MKIVFQIFVLILCVSAPVFGQDTSNLTTKEEQDRIKDAMDEMIQNHKFKFSVFRLAPKVSFSSGIDTNSLYESDQEDANGDFYLSVEPSIDAAVKFGRRAYFGITESLTFLYYKDQEERRNIFNNTRARFVTGGRRTLATIGAGYVTRRATYDVELDVPVDQRVIDGELQIQQTLTNRLDLNPYFRVWQAKLERVETISDLTIDPLDRRSYILGSGLTYQWKPTLSVDSSFNWAWSEELASNTRTEYWNAFGGLTFSSRRLRGNASGGVGRGDSGQGTNHTELLIDSSLDIYFRKRFTVGGFVSRSFQFSSFVVDSTIVTTFGGVRTGFPLTNRLIFDGSYRIGTNDYGDNLVNGVPIETDRFQTGEATLTFMIFKYVGVNVGGLYLKRDSDIPGLDLERFAYTAGIAVNYTLQ